MRAPPLLVAIAAEADLAGNPGRPVEDQNAVADLYRLTTN